jgi:hypothetical protein
MPDFMLIITSLLVLAVAAAIYRTYIRTENSAVLIAADLPDRTNHSSSGEALLKARIGFARR